MEIPIFFSVDDKYAPYLCVAIKSLIENASKSFQYKIIILYRAGLLSEKNMINLSTLIYNNCDISFVNVENRLQSISDRVENRLRADYFTPTIFFRLFIPSMFPEYSKVIYLDSDIVVLGDISKLYRVDIENYLLGACIENFAGETLEEYLNCFIGVDKSEYFNSGVLLMNMDKLRKVCFDEHFLYLYNKYHFECLAPDQDYLNAMCKGNIFVLPKSWNTMPQQSYSNTSLESPINIVHYFLFFKPWNHYNIQYEDFFWNYLKDTYYYDKVVEEQKENVLTSSKNESLLLDTIMQKAKTVVNSQNSFRYVFENKLERRV